LKILDAHCHVGEGMTYSRTAGELLREMDAQSVSGAVITAADRFIAVRNREGNDLVLTAAAEHPDRLFAFAAANPWYGGEAVEELERAFGLGALGLKLHPVLQGFTLSDDIVLPLLELAVEQGKPVYVHTGTPISCTPFQLTELAMRYPRGTFIMGHAAYADFWNDVVHSVSCVPNIFVETSQHLASVIRTLVEQIGADRVVYGSDSPLASMAVEIEKITRYVRRAGDLELILGANLRRILWKE